MSIEYYVSSIANLRSMVDKREIEGSEDWLIFMVMFCCAFEVCLGDFPMPSSLHYSVQNAPEIRSVLTLSVEVETGSDQ